MSTFPQRRISLKGLEKDSSQNSIIRARRGIDLLRKVGTAKVGRPARRTNFGRYDFQKRYSTAYENILNRTGQPPSQVDVAQFHPQVHARRGLGQRGLQVGNASVRRAIPAYRDAGHRGGCAGHPRVRDPASHRWIRRARRGRGRDEACAFGFMGWCRLQEGRGPVDISGAWDNSY